jgi:hypothetical protein
MGISVLFAGSWDQTIVRWDLSRSVKQRYIIAADNTLQVSAGTTVRIRRAY